MAFCIVPFQHNIKQVLFNMVFFLLIYRQPTIYVCEIFRIGNTLKTMNSLLRIFSFPWLEYSNQIVFLYTQLHVLFCGPMQSSYFPTQKHGCYISAL